MVGNDDTGAPEGLPAADVALLTTHPHVKYRPEIDGLRALAVVPVVLFHANKMLLPGGFVGVDVFYVISGFLITSIIFNDIKLDRFSIVTFYERRIRRIIPALYALLFTLITVAIFVFDPKYQVAFAKELLATTLFASNFLYLRQADYFDSESVLKPLLNTWSLSVEEQFYVLFPPALFLLMRYAPKLLKPALALVLLASLALSIVLQPISPDANFYLPFGRAWELLLGSVLAVGAVPIMFDGRLRSILAAVGIAMIASAMVLYDEHTTFPGFTALLPCLGAALFIHCGQGTLTGRLFSAGPLVWIGLISYSLYLWHWPLLAVARYLNLGPLSFPQACGIVVLAVFAAYLSTRYIEKPIRSRGIGRMQLFGAALAATVVILGLAVASIATHGFTGHGAGDPPLAAQISAQSAKFGASPCLMLGSSLPSPGKCRLGAAGDTPTAALLGDSHAAQLAPMIDEVARKSGLVVERLTKARCLPVVRGRFEPADPIQRGCSEFNVTVRQFLDRNPKVRTIFLAARWDIYADDTIRVLPFNGRASSDPKANIARQLADFANVMRARGVRVIIFGQVPVPMSDPAGCLRAAAFNGIDNTKCLSFDGRHARDIDRLVDRHILADAVRRGGAQFIRAYDVYCAADRCDMARDGAMLFMDKAHLSAAGALALGQRLQEKLAIGHEN